MKLRTKFIGIFLAIAFVPLLLTNVGILRYTTNMLVNLIFKERGSLLVNQIGSLNDYLESYRSDVKTVSEFPPFQGIIRSAKTGVDPFDQSTLEHWKRRLGIIFSAFVVSKPNILHMRYIDKDGNEIVRVDSINGKPVVIQEENLQNKSHRDYFQESVKLSQEETYVSTINLNMEGQKIQVPHVPVLRIAKSIFSEADGSFQGIVILNLSVENLLKSIERQTSSNEQLSIFMIDQDGQYIYNPLEKHKEFSQQLGTDFNYLDEEPELRSNLKTLDSKWHEDIQENEFRLWRKIFYDKSNKSRYWVVINRVDKDILFEPITKLFKISIIFGFVVAAIILLISIFLTRSVVKPILLLNQRAKKVAEGDINVDFPDNLIFAKNEIGELAQSFDIMLNKLRGFVLKLEQKVEQRTELLEKRVEELDKFNKVMVGRELKMKQLKEEIENLRKNSS